jgi:hypothetical protein
LGDWAALRNKPFALKSAQGGVESVVTSADAPEIVACVEQHCELPGFDGGHCLGVFFVGPADAFREAQGA